MKITEYTNTANEEMILVEYDNDTTWSGYKSVWDELNADSAGNK